MFDKALNYVVGRHPIMRSVIDEEREKPRFKVFKTVPEVHARHIDVSHLPPSEERAYILQRASNSTTTVSIWANGPCSSARSRNSPMIAMCSP